MAISGFADVSFPVRRQWLPLIVAFVWYHLHLIFGGPRGIQTQKVRDSISLRSKYIRRRKGGGRKKEKGGNIFYARNIQIRHRCFGKRICESNINLRLKF